MFKKKTNWGAGGGGGGGGACGVVLTDFKRLTVILVGPVTSVRRRGTRRWIRREKRDRRKVVLHLGYGCERFGWWVQTRCYSSSLPVGHRRENVHGRTPPPRFERCKTRHTETGQGLVPSSRGGPRPPPSWTVKRSLLDRQARGRGRVAVWPGKLSRTPGTASEAARTGAIGRGNGGLPARVAGRFRRPQARPPPSIGEEGVSRRLRRQSQPSEGTGRGARALWPEVPTRAAIEEPQE
jgi:hypothetical protein